jgi:ferredoxin
VDQLVLREMDRVGYRIARFIEEHGHWAFQTAAQETVWEMKSASYGYLSTRHVAIEAGLGTIGFELNLLTKEAGPRCYTTVVLTDAALEPDGKLTEQLCIGEPCSRCLYSCPPDAVQHWGLDKRRCATFAQEFGFSTILRVFSGFVGANGGEAKLGTLAGHEWFGIWQGLLRVVGAFGDCPRCLAVCPVGADYNQFLKDAQREIPEKTDEKVARARQLLGIRKRGEPIRGMADGRVRWIGEDGYRPPSRRAGTPA